MVVPSPEGVAAGSSLLRQESGWGDIGLGGIGAALDDSRGGEDRAMDEAAISRLPFRVTGPLPVTRKFSFPETIVQP